MSCDRMESQQAGAGIVSSPGAAQAEVAPTVAPVVVPALPMTRALPQPAAPAVKTEAFGLSGAAWREELDLVHLPQRLSHEATMLSFGGLLFANALFLPWASGASNFLIGVFAWLAVSVAFGIASGVAASRLYAAKPFASGLAGLYSLQASLASFFAVGGLTALVASQPVFSSLPALALVFWLFVVSVALFVGLKAFSWFESHALPSAPLARVCGAWLCGLAVSVALLAVLWGAGLG